MAERRLSAVITARDEASQQFRKLRQEAELTNRTLLGFTATGQTFAASFARMTGTLGLAAGAFFGVKAAIQGVVGAAAEAELVQAKLNAVLTSTRGVAGVTAAEVNKLADTLSMMTRFDDEAIVGAQNLLLTFTRIGKDVFPDATEAILDMATAMDQDLKTTAIQVGKALNDPIAGVTALRRVGVQLTTDQQKLIESMIKVGDVAGAQRVILAELTTEFGGAAKAAGSTLSGQLDILSTKFGNLAEKAGKVVIPVLSGVVDWLGRVADAADWAGGRIAAALTAPGKAGLPEEAFPPGTPLADMLGKGMDFRGANAARRGGPAPVFGSRKGDMGQAEEALREWLGLPKPGSQAPAPPTLADIIAAAQQNAGQFAHAETLARKGSLEEAASILISLGAEAENAANQVTQWRKAEVDALAAHNGSTTAIREEAGATAELVGQMMNAKASYDAWRESMRAALMAGDMTAGQVADEFGKAGITATEAFDEITAMQKENTKLADDYAKAWAEALDIVAKRKHEQAEWDAKQVELEKQVIKDRAEEQGRVIAEEVDRAFRAGQIISQRAADQMRHDGEGKIPLLDAQGIWRGGFTSRPDPDSVVLTGQFDANGNPVTVGDVKRSGTAWSRELRNQLANAEAHKAAMAAAMGYGTGQAELLRSQAAFAAFATGNPFAGPLSVLSGIGPLLQTAAQPVGNRDAAGMARRQSARDALPGLGTEYGFSLPDIRLLVDGSELGRVAGMPMAASGALAARFGVS